MLKVKIYSYPLLVVVPITPIPEGYTEYTPGADEPITPIQEVVQLSPPTPVANER